jgi:hypothetical protein
MTGGLTNRYSAVAMNIAMIMVSLLFGLMFGLNYGLSNQNTYLLHGLKLFDSSLFKSDWLTSQCTDYHPIFTYLTCFLYILNSGGWAIAIMNVLTTALGAVILYFSLRELVEKEIVFPVFLMVLGIMGVTLTFSVSASYIFSDIFQPSSIGSLGLLAAIWFFLSEQFLISGICLAAGGIFHANFLILGFPLFLLAHILLGRKGFLPRVIEQLGPSALALIPLIPLILKTSGSPYATEAREILFNIRSPHHYKPAAFWKEFIPFIGWLLSSIALGKGAFHARNKQRLLLVLLISHMVLIGGATILSSIIYIPSIAQLYFWRLAPFAALLLQIITCVGAIKILPKSNEEKFSIGNLLLLAAGLGLVNVYYIHNHEYRLFVISLIIFALALSARFSWLAAVRRAGRLLIAPMAVGIIIWVLGCVWPLKGFVDASSLLRGLSQEETALYKWVDTTSKDAVFLIPPGFQRFRLHARRAVIVDWKSTPILPAELVEWYKRIETVSGISGVSSLDEADKGFYKADRNRLQEIKNKYDYDYLVVRTNEMKDSLAGFHLIFENPKYRVLQE